MKTLFVPLHFVLWQEDYWHGKLRIVLYRMHSILISSSPMVPSVSIVHPAFYLLHLHSRPRHFFAAVVAVEELQRRVGRWLDLVPLHMRLFQRCHLPRRPVGDANVARDLEGLDAREMDRCLGLTF